MEIYLIRHTTPAIEKGICYGQSDLDVTETFAEEAAAIAPHLPERFAAVYSSPLQRCRKLAEQLFPTYPIRFDDRLKEIHCGEWELLGWDSIDPVPLKAWMDDFVNVCIPGGESYTQLYERVVHFLETLPQPDGPVAIVTHGGVIRSVLAHVREVALQDSFDAFSIHYGCLVRLQKAERGFDHHFLHNVKRGEERHRPEQV